MAELLDRGLVEVWQRRHKRRTGRRVDTTTHPDDEMLAFIRRIDPRAPIAHYLDTGAAQGTALTSALTAAGRTLDPHAPLLEFACGHGRFTRHLVNLVDPACITVADIHPVAVEFVTATFDVDGFVSVTDPNELDHDGRYETIFVASLFSHLPHHRWVPWADRLLDLLAPGGVLVISTNGPPTDLHEVEPGFCYGPDNETAGRLDPTEYGTTYVDAAWVRRSIAGDVLAHQARALWGVQDIYVIAR